MEMKELNYKVSGNVQGVCFRSEAVDTARSVGVAGWVRNNPDGAVEGIAVGEHDNVNKLQVIF
ncbi:hypothetical protein M407DRAFT_198465 [Tulasnella calospora MUT 4182]|uniref:Acylphosphatase n=1 Tax=Tulasnella calospora MUT 4182 TaxID=1051891 RepID=A0A0C3QKW5_9AGAM|nr:hypothetical protein M407DRAFT_198465 [Tulasnella calospora MUT 4182]